MIRKNNVSFNVQPGGYMFIQVRIEIIIINENSAQNRRSQLIFMKKQDRIRNGTLNTLTVLDIPKLLN